MDRRTILAGGLGFSALLVAGCRSTPQPGATSAPRPSATQTAPPERSLIDPRVDRTIADGLAVPWAIVFLKDGSALVTQRDRATLVRVTPEGTVTPIDTVPGVRPGGEGGLLGLAIDPNDDRSVFVHVTTTEDNRVLRYNFDGKRLSKPEVILRGLDVAAIHHGGALVFDAEGHLLVSVGDAAQPHLAQDRNSRQGKILRITTEGKPAPGNPFDNEIWSWGHRNIEGLAFDGSGRLWASEFGSDRFDELNLIEPGNNYGWPEAEGDEGGKRFTRPFATWPTAKASPAGLAITDDHAYLGALRGRRLWRVPLTGDSAGTPEDFFEGEFGRIRSLAVAPDGSLWMGTSNRDGRGDPAPEDDRILRVLVSMKK